MLTQIFNNVNTKALKRVWAQLLEHSQAIELK